MTIRSKSSTKKESANKTVTHETTKRQPFGVIVDGKSQKKSVVKRKKERRKSRQIGDHVILFIQERNSKTKTLHRAKVDPKTGGITYTPANRKTPIAYDRNRHALIETTPEGDQIELELDCDAEKENIDSSSLTAKGTTSKANTNVQQQQNSRTNDSCAPTKKDTCRVETRRRTGTLQPTHSYAESTDPESSSDNDDDDDESDFEAPAKKSAAANHKNATAGAKNRDKKATGKKKEHTATTPSRFIQEYIDEESDLDEPPVKKSKAVRRVAAAASTKNPDKKIPAAAAAVSKSTIGKKSSRNKIRTEALDDSSSSDAAEAPRECPANFSSPIVKSNWEEQPDWRCTGAIDY